MKNKSDAFVYVMISIFALSLFAVCVIGINLLFPHPEVNNEFLYTEEEIAWLDSHGVKVNNVQIFYDNPIEQVIHNIDNACKNICDYIDCITKGE